MCTTNTPLRAWAQATGKEASGEHAGQHRKARKHQEEHAQLLLAKRVASRLSTSQTLQSHTLKGQQELYSVALLLPVVSILKA